MDFIEYCDNHQILLCILAPHSIHMLHQLDVKMIKPLSSSYSKGLINYLHKTQGLVSIKKGNVFPLFWQAWISSFKETSILKSFEESSGSLSDTDWRKVRKILDQSVGKEARKEAKKISLSVRY
jgi:hypothetical protein